MFASATILRWLSALALSLAVTTPLYAQEEAAEPATESAPAAEPTFAGVEEIVITATKRATNIQDVPIAVTAITAEGLEARGITDVKELQQAAPSLSITESNSTTNGGTIRIRGMGTSGNNPGLESAVGSFIDGVYRSRSGLALQDLIDVERVEILRGPQGTLFGKNTSAGLVHIITKKPEWEWGGHVGGTVGNYDLRKTQGSITGPLIEDKLAFRFAGIYHVRDGYLDDIDTKDTFADRDRWAMKGQFLFTPTDTLDFRFIGDYTKMREHCCPATYSIVGRNAKHILNLGGALFGGSTDAIVGPIILAPLSPGSGTYSGGRNDDNLKVGTNYDPQEDVNDWGLSIDMNWDLDPVKVKGILAHRQTDIFRGQDIDFTNVDILRSGATNETWENWSLELQFSGGTERVDWLFGMYGYTEDLTNDFLVNVATQGPEYIGRLVEQAVSPVTGNPALRAAFQAQFNVDEGRHSDLAQDNKGYSFFTHNIIHLTEQWNLTLGARYGWERKEGSVVHDGTAVGSIYRSPFCDRITGFSTPPLGAGTSNLRNAIGINLRTTLSNTCDNYSWDESYQSDDWTGTIQLGYAITEDINAYLSASRGFKSGGYNLDADAFNCIPAGVVATQSGAGPVPVPQPPGTVVSGNIYCTPDDQTYFKPEFSNAYEFGLKSAWFGGRLVANLALFYTDFQDFQLNQFTGLGFIIRNVPQVLSHGAELEMTAFPMEGLIGNLSITYADTRYGDNVDTCFSINRPDLSVNRCPGQSNAVSGCEDDPPLGTTVPPCFFFPTNQNAAGKRITQSPSLTASLQLSMQKPLFSTGWFWYSGGNVYYRGKHKTSTDLDFLKAETAHTKLNLQGGFRSPEERLDIQIWINNVTDEIVTTGNFDTVFQAGSFSAFKQTPRTYGVTASYRFGE